jgi:hypothetical protein
MFHKRKQILHSIDRFFGMLFTGSAMLYMAKFFLPEYVHFILHGSSLILLIISQLYAKRKMAGSYT